MKVNYPSLGMDFVYDADGRYTLNGTAYNDLPSFLTATGGTFSRASIGTYYDSTGTLQTATANTPRFDHDPVTHAPKGILIEESRTNVIIDSENLLPFASASHSISDSPVVAPDNGISHQIVFSSGVPASSGRTFSGSIPLTIGQDVTGTIWIGALAGYPTSISVGILNTNDTWGNNVDSIAEIISGPGIIVNQFGGLFRFSGLSNSTLTKIRITRKFQVAGIARFFFYPNTSSGVTTGGNIVWGAQLEQGSFPTSYIPTTTAAVTRAADNLTVPVGAWYNASTTTIFGTYSSFAVNGYSTRIASLNDGASSNVFQLADASGGIILAQKAIGGSILNSSGPPYVPNTAYKIAGAMDISSGPLAVNNTLYNNTNAGLPLGITRIQIGNANGVSFLNGWISQLKYYPSRAPNTQLQLLTQ